MVMTCSSGWNSTTTNNSSSNRSCPSPLTCCQFEAVVTMDYMIYFNFLGCVLLPLLLMMTIYIHIFTAARRQLRLTGPKLTQAPPLNVQALPSSQTARSRLRAELHAARSLALLVGVFTLCWLPLHLLNVYHRLCQGCSRSPEALMSTAIVLSHANSAINPVIYACRLPEFRLAFCRILQQKVLCHHCCHQGAVQPCCDAASVTPSSSHISQEGLSCITVVDGALNQTDVCIAGPGGSVKQLPHCFVGFYVDGGAKGETRHGGF